MNRRLVISVDRSEQRNLICGISLLSLYSPPSSAVLLAVLLEIRWPQTISYGPDAGSNSHPQKQHALMKVPRFGNHSLLPKTEGASRLDA
jgi:hypothetical protein